ncbi:RNA recognition motif. (a.k.a. RRM, RBD, or RNP domain) [Seminavis robusta]|uniref:RNA recognition motif. (A.k.a. RRM, RBD, or RNP domain) n=1 Tax=Seminavis robusta TaxID=568900 RepID=A0A9N8DPI5_9STRA|nr:RNA recognition motif. (a.k.a. RRM, RBD, or RNP domain) [Seminavis robusta]|eukprot:Sro199_g084300.1 RNA recognition motif. (a.k.a. RRM, RBD, or RNP domain) (421) ;mRNA; f:27456-28718
MAKKKSAAQVRRLKARAEKRGEEYVAPEVDSKASSAEQDESTKTTSKDTTTESTTKKTKTDSKRITAARKLKKELLEIQNQEDLRAKERRSLKRKAEAIAAEEVGCSVEEMQQWYQDNQHLLEEKTEKGDKKGASSSHKKTPYIVFVGQLAFTTTAQALLAHIRTELAESGLFAKDAVSEETVKVRLLTDPKTKKSRGMAFVELADPEIMYACLRLHHTLLDGRRLNVERSAGGRKKETRDAKIKQYRQEQEDYLSNVVDTIMAEFFKSGELKQGELDEGAIAMCKRYSAGMVETAIKQYIENNGSTMDNTSAYFSYLLAKLASEGIDNNKDQQGSSNNHKRGDRPPDSSKPSSNNKRPKTDFNKNKQSTTIASRSALPQVDFGISEKKSDSHKKPNLSDMFPSLASRGGGRRGRGRGYM